MPAATGPGGSARQKTCCPAPRHGRGIEERRCHRLGREPDHDRAHVRRGPCPDQGRRLVAGRHLDPADMAAPAVGLQETASVERFFGRRWRRLHPAGFARRGAWPNKNTAVSRSRSEATSDVQFSPDQLLKSRHAAGSRCSTSSAEQPRLPSRIHVSGRHGGAARPRHRSGKYRYRPSRTRISDFATLARGMGVSAGEGRIVDPKDLAGALARAVAVAGTKPRSRRQ